MSRPGTFFRFVFTALLSASAVAAAASPAAAQTAEVRYERALAREGDARDDSGVTIASLRSIATAYEGIVRRYPRSGYCDNALWQAAGLLQLAWERGGQERDRDKALSLLTWLRREYPSSSLIRGIGLRSAELERPRVPASQRARVEPPTADAASTKRSTSAAIPEADIPGNDPVPVPAPFPGIPPAATRSDVSSARNEAAVDADSPTLVAIRGMSHTRLPHGERLTFELERETTFAVAPQPADGGFVLTLSDAEAASAIVDAAERITGDVIETVRLHNTSAGLQVQVAVEGHPRQSAFLLYGPDRVVFDFETPNGSVRPSAAAVRAAGGEPPASVPATSAASPPSSAGPDAHTGAAAAVASIPEIPVSADLVPIEPASEIPGGYSLARQLGLGVSRVVIDPGHGGHDPGAQANGVTEARVVLDIALRVEKLLLEQPGFEVVLTRRTHTAVALEQRTAIANEEAADLFVSIHANSSSRRQTAGVETYFLNLATDPEAESLAARENASSSQAMHTLPQLVRAITTNNKIAESRELATTVQSSLVGHLQPRNDNFTDLGVKQAPFVVLIGAQMPSVLAEVAFLTNRTEAGLLKQEAYRQRIAQALADAILRYRASLKKAETVTASTGER